MIAVFFASRSRPTMFKTAYQALLDHADNPDNIFVALRVDHDDYDLNSYIPILRKQDEMIIGSKAKISIANLYEELYERFDNYDIYLCLNDDTVCRTRGWDSKIIEYFDQLPSKIGTVRLSDGYCIDAILFAHSKEWIKSLGFMLPKRLPDGEEMTGGEDTYIEHLGLTLRIRGYGNHYVDMTNIVFEHIHPMYKTRIPDSIDHANEVRRRKCREQYKKKLADIPADAQRIIDAINASK